MSMTLTTTTVAVQTSRTVAAADDVRGLRQRLQLSQAAFSKLFGINICTLRDWEQGRRSPEGPTRILLSVIEHAPDAVVKAMDVTRAPG